jgi:RNA polymerase sigma-70 factor, ECF subfamily
LSARIAKAKGGAPVERRLLEDAQAGDERAFADLIRGFDQSFRLLAYRLLSDRREMEDALQEAYVKAFLGLPRFRGESALSTWLYRIVYNSCLDQLRRVPKEERALHVEPSAVATDPADLVATRATLEEALAALAPIDRAAVLLVDAEGLSYDDTATIVGVPRGTIASRLSRARASLRRSLGINREGVSR